MTTRTVLHCCGGSLSFPINTFCFVTLLPAEFEHTVELINRVKTPGGRYDFVGSISKGTIGCTPNSVPMVLIDL